MLKHLSLALLALCAVCSICVQAQKRTTTLVQSILDESIIISTDKPVYFPGDTLHLTIQREDSSTRAIVTPLVAIEGVKLNSDGQGTYIAVIPQIVTPGSYRILLRIRIERTWQAGC